MYNELKKALEQEKNERMQNLLKFLEEGDEYNNTPEKALSYVVRWYLDKKKPYSGTLEEQKQKAIKGYKKKLDKELNAEFKHLEEVAQAQALPNPIYITVEWKKSYMWGSNPTATDNYGNTSGSIGGCGYDKLSTAVARVLNQHKRLLQAMYDFKNDYLREHEVKDHNATHREILDYGSGYGILPKFEGGVGVNCFKTILSKVGYEMKQISSTKSTDVFMITKKEVE
jgi:hypothetical protein